MTEDPFQKIARLANGTFLEEDRNSNYPSENTLPNAYKDLCQKLVNVWDETVKSSGSADQRRKDLCAKVEWIVSSARARLNNC